MEKENVAAENEKAAAENEKADDSRRAAGRGAAGRNSELNRRAGTASRRTRGSRAAQKRAHSRKGKAPAAGLPKVKIPPKFLAAGAGLLFVLIVIILIARGCGISNKSPEGVVKSLVSAYVKGNERKIKKCYGVKEADDNLQEEIDATIKYFQAHSTEGVSISECNSIYTDGSYTYVYITYELELKSGQSYPCISTYMVQKNDKDKYYVLTSSEITDDMSKQAAEQYAKFMNTDSYKDYVTAYDKFIKKNPGYEDKIATKLS